MADLYSIAKGSKLKLKGAKNNLLPKKKKRKATDGGSGEKAEERRRMMEIEADTKAHGGWWVVSKVEEVCGTAAIEFGDRTYVKCLDDGTFTLGPPHDEGDGPSPEEIFTAIRINDEKVALKSGYGKYLGVDSRTSDVVGRSDAVGAVEQWELVFQEGKMALLAHNGYFMTIDEQEDSVVCKRRKAGPAEIVKLRCNAERKEKKSSDVPEEEAGSLKDVEVNYVKKFQKFQDKKMRLCAEDLEEVKKAKEGGNLHETLLDRRSKMKADRYCK